MGWWTVNAGKIRRVRPTRHFHRESCSENVIEASFRNIVRIFVSVSGMRIPRDAVTRRCGRIIDERFQSPYSPSQHDLAIGRGRRCEVQAPKIIVPYMRAF